MDRRHSPYLFQSFHKRMPLKGGEYLSLEREVSINDSTRVRFGIGHQFRSTRGICCSLQIFWQWRLIWWSPTWLRHCENREYSGGSIGRWKDSIRVGKEQVGWSCGPVISQDGHLTDYFYRGPIHVYWCLLPPGTCSFHQTPRSFNMILANCRRDSGKLEQPESGLFGFETTFFVWKIYFKIYFLNTFNFFYNE